MHGRRISLVLSLFLVALAGASPAHAHVRASETSADAVSTMAIETLHHFHPESPSTGNQVTFRITNTGTVPDGPEVFAGGRSTELTITGNVVDGAAVAFSDLRDALAAITLDPGESVDVTYVFDVADGAGGRDLVISLAIESRLAPGPLASAAAHMSPPVRRGVAVTPDGTPATVAAGDEAQATFTVRNAGNAADRVALALPEPPGALEIRGYTFAGAEHPTLASLDAALAAAPALASGATLDVGVRYRVVRAESWPTPIGGQTFDLGVRFRSRADASATDTGSVGVLVPVAYGPAPAVTPSTALSPSTANEARIDITNRGTVADGFTLAVTPSAGLTVAGYRWDGKSYATAAQLNAHLSGLALRPGTAQTVAVLYAVDAHLGGQQRALTVTATSSGDPGSERSVVGIVSVLATPGVEVTHPGGGSAALEPGSRTTTFAVRNTGNSPDIVTLTAAGTGTTVVTVDGRPGTSAPIALQPGEERGVEVTHAVSASAPGLAAELTVTGRSAYDPAVTSSAVVAIAVRRPVLTTAITVLRADGTPVGAGSVAPGEEIEYRLAVTNTGSEEARAVQLEHALPARDTKLGVRAEDAGTTFATSPSAGATLVAIASVPAGQTRAAVVRARVGVAPEGTAPTTTLYALYDSAAGVPFVVPEIAVAVPTGFTAKLAVAGEPAVFGTPTRRGVTRFTVTNQGNGADTFRLGARSTGCPLEPMRYVLDGVTYDGVPALNDALATRSIAPGASLVVGGIYLTELADDGRTCLSRWELSSGRQPDVTAEGDAAIELRRTGVVVVAPGGPARWVPAPPAVRRTATFTVRNDATVGETLTLAAAGTGPVTVVSVDGVAGASRARAFAGGETRTVDVVYTVAPDAAVGAQGSVGLTAASGIDPDTTADATLAVEAVRPALTVDATPVRADGSTPLGADGTLSRGEAYAWRVTVTNGGSAEARDVAARVALPARDALTGEATAAWPALAPAESRTFLVRAVVGAGAREADPATARVETSWTDAEGNAYAPRSVEPAARVTVPPAQAAPPSPPTTGPPAQAPRTGPPATAPRITASLRRALRLTTQGTVRLGVTCTTACTARAALTIRVGGRTTRLTARTVRRTSAGTTRLTFTLPAAVRRAVRAGRPATVTATITAPGTPRATATATLTR